ENPLLAKIGVARALTVELLYRVFRSSIDQPRSGFTQLTAKKKRPLPSFVQKTDARSCIIRRRANRRRCLPEFTFRLARCSGKPVVIFPPPPTFPAHKSVFHLSRVGGINQ